MTESGVNNNSRYKWLVCLACGIFYYCALGFSSSSFGAYLPYIKASINASNTLISYISAIRLLTSMIAVSLAARVYAKKKPFVGVCISFAFLCAAFIIMFFAENIILYYIAAVFLGFAYSFCGSIAVSVILGQYFSRNYSAALSLTMLGSAINTSVNPIISNFLIKTISLKGCFLVQTGFIVLSGIFVVLIVKRNPQGLDLSEEGSRDKVFSKGSTDLKPFAEKDSRLMVFAMFCLGYASYTVAQTYTLHLTQTGLTKDSAAALFSLYGTIAIFIKLIMGFVTDRYGAFRPSIIFLIPMAVSSGLLTFITVSFPYGFFLASSVCWGLGIGLATLGQPLWVRDLVPKEEQIKTLKNWNQGYMAGGLVTAFTAGPLSDITGSYRIVYAITAFAVLVLILTLIYAYRKQSK